MIKQPGVVRERVLADVMHMLKHLYLMLTMLPDTETEVLLALESPRSEALAIDISNLMMARFGHEVSPTEPRFDKTRRALAKKEKPLRGGNTFDNSADRRKRGRPRKSPNIPLVVELTDAS